MKSLPHVRFRPRALLLVALSSLLVQGCAVVTAVDTVASVAVGTVGLAASAVIGTARLAGSTVGAAADVVLPGPGK